MTIARIRKWTRKDHKFIVGYADVELTGGIILLGVAICNGKNGLEVRPKEIPIMGHDGRQLSSLDGKMRVQKSIDYANAQAKIMFDAAVLNSICAAYPNELP